MITKSLLFKKIRDHKVIENIIFEEADSGVNSSEISDNLKMSFFWSKYIIFFIIITLEILIAASLSGWLVNKPVFAGLEWLLVLFSAVYFFKINLKSLTKIYLTRYYSSCSIIFMICSFICAISLWVLLLTFSGERTKERIGQMMFQSVVSITGFILLSIIIYKYIQYMVIKEISYYSKETKIPLIGKIIDKFAIYGIIIVFSSMQFYRWNKFWIEGSSSWIAIRLVPIVQIILWIIVLFLLITLPIRLYYPKFLQSYLLQRYSEEFRNKYDFTQKEWYGE